MKRLLIICAVAAIVLAPSGLAQAAITSTTGAIDDSLSIPPDLTTGVFEGDIIFVFEEQQNLILSADLYMDITEPGTYAPPSPTLTPGTIESGTTVNSYIVHFDEEGGERLTLSGSITFDSDILGVIVLTDSLDDSDSLAGAPGTTYDPIGNDPYHIVRGLDIFTHNQDPISLTVDYRTVSFTLTTLNGIDEIRIIEAPAQCVPPPSGLVSWWPGDGDASDIWNGNAGTLVGDTSFAAGVVGQGFDLDGTGDYVEVPHNANLNLAQMTVDAWIFIDPDGTETAGQFNSIVSKSNGSSAGGGFFLGHDDRGAAAPPPLARGTNALRFVVLPSSNDLTTETYLTNAFPTAGFYHVAGTRDSLGIARLYLNGVLVDTAATSTAGSTNNLPLRIGGANFSADFEGIIDEVEIFNRALSVEEIQGIYNAGSAGKCKVVEIEVDIDIKPGSYPNAINLGSRGLTPIAIFSVLGEFDATDLDPSTISLAGAPVVSRGKDNSKYMAHEEDTDGDGLLDLVVQVATSDIDPSQLVAVDDVIYAFLTGKTFGGEDVEGADEVTLVSGK